MILFVTGNENKFKEVYRNINTNIKQSDIDLVEIQGTPNEIILNKCKEAVKIQGKIDLFVEDISLCFNVLNGFPGPYIKWALKSLGNEKLYKLLDGFEDKSGYAICMYCYYNSKIDEYSIFSGKTDGLIVKPRGSLNFGWDSIFQPLCSNKTYAEMEFNEKDSISHRSKALKLMKKYLEKF